MHTKPRETSRTGMAAGEGETSLSRRYQNPGGRKQNGLSLSHSPSESGWVGAPHVKGARDSSPSCVCTARPGATPTTAGMGSPSSGPSAPPHRSLQQSRGQGPAPSRHLSRDSSHQLVSGGLGGTPSTGHFRRDTGASGCRWPSLVPKQVCVGVKNLMSPPTDPASYLLLKLI